MRFKQHKFKDIETGGPIAGIIQAVPYKDGLIIITSDGKVYSNVNINTYDENNPTRIPQEIPIRGQSK